MGYNKTEGKKSKSPLSLRKQRKEHSPDIVIRENNKKFVPIGLKGRVKCKVTGPVEIGDLIVTSDITGVGIVNNNANNGIIIGKALENSNDTGIKEIIVLI